MSNIARSLLAAACIPIFIGASCAHPWQPAGPQGWSDGETIAWYTASQGSRLVPRQWLDALEQPDGQGRFLDAAYVAKFRYLPMPAAAAQAQQDPGCSFDPDLPMGFPVDCQDDTKFTVTKLRWKPGQGTTEAWVGMNCSACHTAQLDIAYTDSSNVVRTKTVTAEGGPTLADFQGFMQSMNNALHNTLNPPPADPGKFARFAAAVLGTNHTAADDATLKAAMATLVSWNTQLAYLNSDSATPYGFGRLDAIGHIFNKVALEAMRTNGFGQTPNPADAPVSYPFLWNVPQLNKVEWNGIADNTPLNGLGTFDAGALGRNTGEVIGVFADINLLPDPGVVKGYDSSIRVDRLDEMEQQLRELLPPQWPAELPLKPELVAAGRKLFSDHCAECHTVPTSSARTDPAGSLAQKFKVTLTPIGNPAGATDMWMACNAVFDSAESGVLAGRQVNVLPGGKTFAATSDNLGLVQHAVVGGLLAQKGQVVAQAAEDLFGLNRGLPLPRVGFAAKSKDQRRAECVAAINDKTNLKNADLVYKGRPLQGIWATSPYLHNGSVPTLYDLLLPPAQRNGGKPIFYTGTRAFDARNVGFMTTQSADNDFAFDVTKDGNSNAGHDYGNAAFSDDDRYAIIEYMKTL